MLKIFITIVAAAAVSAASIEPTLAASKNTPGHVMQQRGSVAGHPGASGYAPGHVKKMSRSNHNARAYAPGRKHRSR